MVFMADGLFYATEVASPASVGAAVLTAEVLGGSVCYATEVVSPRSAGAATSVVDLFYTTKVVSPREYSVV